MAMFRESVRPSYKTAESPFTRHEAQRWSGSSTGLVIVQALEQNDSGLKVIKHCCRQYVCSGSRSNEY